MLALPYGDDDDNIVYSPYTLADYLFKRIEPAGKYFEEYAERKLNNTYTDDFINLNNAKDIIIEEDQEEYEWEKEYKEESKNQNINFTQKENYYAILGLEELVLTATSDDIRRAYKKLAMVYHPDKNKENNALLNETEEIIEAKPDMTEAKAEMTEEEKKKLEINKKWLTIKDAYDTLLDPEKRKKYDSTFEFDDKTPDENKSYDDKTFFKSFGPVFLKNSIWSKKKPIPKIGDMNTPLNKVRIFYQFWFSFDSWRDFAVDGEYNLEDAQSRYEKRQMSKENKKMKSSMVKEEKTRISKLVEQAYKNDPRIKAEEEKVAIEREKLKQERIIQKQIEKEAAEERARQMKREYEENQRIQQERLVKEKEELLSNVLSLAEGLNVEINNNDKFTINLNGNIECFKAIFNGTIEKPENERVKTFILLANQLLGLRLKSEDNIDESTIWKKEEIHLLQKAVKKYPAGTKNRWEKINEIVKTKSTNLIIQMTHYLTTTPNVKIENDIDLSQLNKPKEKKEEKKEEKKDEDFWSEEQQKLLEAALKKHPSSLSANERWGEISKDVPGKTKKQCVERYKYLSQLIKNKK
jgi:DnaJ family protein C protein 2